MKKYLKSFYLQADAEMQTLTKNANSVFLLKLLYLRRERTVFGELYKDYKKELGSDSISEEEVQSLLDDMVSKNQIHFHEGRYYLSTSRISKIDKTREASANRKERIVSTYFERVYSSKEQILEWLDDVLVFFFDTYSTEWVSDLFYNKNYIQGSKASLLKTITTRTQNNKQIDKRDRASLPDMFVRMLLAHNDSDVNNMLWEYGTTAFSAKLITATHGANPVALDFFRGSVCYLDTNILMNIGLEEGNYYKTLNSLEKVYEHLGIEVKILPITKEEYLHTIQNIKQDVVRLVSKGYSDTVLMKTGDQYIRTAIQRKCETEEDYEIFFSALLSLPQHFHERLEIAVEDDVTLDEIVAQSQADQQKIDNLRALHESIHSVRKATHSLIHDVGLIEGVEYVRQQRKAFILSQDSTIAAYSKRRPLKEGLTLSIQMETLINVLALDSGGVEVDPRNYIPLFAEMIRQGIVPDEKTFHVQDLARMIDMEQDVSRLPDEDVIKLATDIATMRMQGESEEQIGLTFRRELQDIKRGIVDELEDTKRDVENERTEKERYKNLSDRGEKGLEKEVRSRIAKSYNRKLRLQLLGVITGFLIIPGILITLYFVLSKKIFDDIWENIVLSVGVEIVAGLITFVILKPGRLLEDYRKRKETIEEEVKKELIRYYEK